MNGRDWLIRGIERKAEIGLNKRDPSDRGQTDLTVIRRERCMGDNMQE